MYLSVPVIILIALIVYWTWPKYPPTAEQLAALKEQRRRRAEAISDLLDAANAKMDQRAAKREAKRRNAEEVARRSAIVSRRPMTTKDWDRVVMVVGGLLLIGAVALALS